MEKFVIDGRRRLSGEVTPSGNKNESLPVLAATLLTEEPVILDNLPRIRDVLVMCDVIVRQGGEVEWLGPNRVKIVPLTCLMSRWIRNFANVFVPQFCLLARW